MTTGAGDLKRLAAMTNQYKSALANGLQVSDDLPKAIRSGDDVGWHSTHRFIATTEPLPALFLISSDE